MALIKNDDINQIKDKANIIDVVSRHVQLKKAGRTYKGLCPFHKEKSPSFTVDPVKQLYHCFGCGEGGDIISFIMKTEGLDFNEAVESLAQTVGHVIQYESVKKRTDGNSRLYQVNEAARDYYHKVLMSGIGEQARSYLKSRGFDKGITEAMRLGYAPGNWDSLYRHLTAQNYTQKEMDVAGLLSKNARGRVYDRFRGRLLFAIDDIQGRVIAFGGRIIGEGEPKYLNSPETPIYNKSKVLYNVFSAKNHIFSRGHAIVVEGYTDVMSLAKNGVENAVATCGTALTYDHLRLLSRFTENIVLVFDGDDAGISAAERGVDYLQSFFLPNQESLRRILNDDRLIVKVLILPEKLDPADFVDKYGIDRFKDLINKAKFYSDFYLDRIMEKHNIDDRIERKKAYKETLDFISIMSGALDQEDYLKRTSEIFNTSFEMIQKDFIQLLDRKKRRQPGPAFREPPPRQSASSLAEKEMLKCILQFPEASSYLQELEPGDWQDNDLAQLYLVLKNKLLGKGKISSEEINRAIHELPIKHQKMVSRLTLDPVTAENSELYALEIFLKLKEYAIDRRIYDLIEQLKKTETEDEMSKEIEREINTLQKQRVSIRNQFA